MDRTKKDPSLGRIWLGVPGMTASKQILAKMDVRA